MPSQAAAVQAGPRGERMSWKLWFSNNPMMSLSYRPIVASAELIGAFVLTRNRKRRL